MECIPQGLSLFRGSATALKVCASAFHTVTLYIEGAAKIIRSLYIATARLGSLKWRNMTHS